ncbi:MAG: IPTL-CTERM sorting domain-containing protein [Bacteroidetes bacterium]|nr:IPTL-CTERM sorting domain-containing protein [Bacteroidota bacterium]
MKKIIFSLENSRLKFVLHKRYNPALIILLLIFVLSQFDANAHWWYRKKQFSFLYEAYCQTGCYNYYECEDFDAENFPLGAEAYCYTDCSSYVPGGYAESDVICNYVRVKGKNSRKYPGCLSYHSTSFNGLIYSFSRDNLIFHFVVDSINRNVTIVFDTLFMSISKLSPLDSSYTNFEIILFVPQSDSDTIPNPANTFFAGGIVLYLGNVSFEGGLTSSGFNVVNTTDSIYITAYNLSKFAQYYGPSNTFKNLTMVGGGESFWGSLLNPPPVYGNHTIPTLSQWGMIILGFILLSLGVVYIFRRRNIIINN